MRTHPGFNLERSSNIWDWNSFPAVVVRAEVDPLLVKLDQGATSQVLVEDLDSPDPARRGSGRPRSHCRAGCTANHKLRGQEPSRLMICANQLAGAVVELPRMKAVGL